MDAHVLRATDAYANVECESEVQINYNFALSVHKFFMLQCLRCDVAEGIARTQGFI